MPYEPVPSRVSFPELEVVVGDRWKRDDVFRRSIQQRQGRDPFVFYEGPPTANGLPHMGHVVQRTLKDLFPRYRTMRGHQCVRKAGWDTHGLPVEIEVEKELGLTGKQQIEELGIAEFNRRCRESVFRYVAEWTRFTEKLGYWVDLEDPYVTYQSAYIESVWAILKRIHEQDLLYRGYKVVPYCPRCATPLSSHELSLGYQDDVEDPSVYVRFRLADEPGTSLLAWTTTPWTLPGNVALAVGADIQYVKVRFGDERLILAEARLAVLEGEYQVLERLHASELVGLRYQPLYEYLVPDEPAFFVVEADFVSVEDGTGIVHTAAAYGEDDLRLCQDKGIPVRHVVDLRGRFREEVTPFAGMFVKDADPVIIQDLRDRGLLLRSDTIRHTYPFCWRCSTPLLYYALDSWFIRMSSLREQMLEANRSTQWFPRHIQDGRMGNWLEGGQDWSLSRLRFWGTPLPIWTCESCARHRCVGSVAELGLTLEDDLHRPFIDEITLQCADCDGTMRRVPDLIDVWFDSGSMPFAQYHWPFENEQLFYAQFPADFICEGLDQTRGWFYTLMAISVLLTGRNSYRNCLVHGTVTDRQGRKQSKSIGNVDHPIPLIERFGADSLRWYVCTATAIGGDYRFSPEAVQEAATFLVKFWNTYSFLVTYANLDGWDHSRPVPDPADRPIFDRWQLARLHQAVGQVQEELDQYDYHAAARALEKLLEDTSDWYVRRSRRRFWKSESDTDKAAAYATLYETIVTFSQLLAPVCPFIADAVWSNLGGEAATSVHLSDWPVARPELVDRELLSQMERCRRIVEAGRAARESERIRARQPLAAAEVTGAELDPELTTLVRDELNVKEVRFIPGDGVAVTLDTNITAELLNEGIARDVVRHLQVLRKEAGFQIDDRVQVRYRTDGRVAAAIGEWTAYISQEVLADHVARVDGDAEEFHGKELKVEGQPVWLGVRRVP
ncbi:MAG: isoleucine--tRNA ligase [Candidatus Dormibacteria bacterium]